MGVKHICVRIPALSNTADTRALLMLAWSSLANWRHEMDLNCHLLCKVGRVREKVFSGLSNKRAWLCSWDIQIQELPLSKYGTVVDMKQSTSWTIRQFLSLSFICEFLHVLSRPAWDGGGASLIWSLYKQDWVQCTSLLGREKKCICDGVVLNKKNLICFGR